jgi:formylmethanofuran dehydrogenase subunit C
MSALVLTLKEHPPQRCDLSPLSPDRLAAEPGAIERLDIRTSRQPLLVGDIFTVTPGDPSDIVFEGGSERFDNLGTGMSQGRIRVTGDLGERTGHGMSGGELSVSGNVGHLAGSGMTGGKIEITGSAGDLAGGPLPGEANGIKGGVIHIRGNAGQRAGDRMQRGLIAIEGSAGVHLASRMRGGTIVCFGEAGDLPGYLMTRGTVLIGKGAPLTTPTFVETGVHELVALRLLAHWLIEESIEGGWLAAARLRRLVGDTAVLGKGEIFVPETIDARSHREPRRLETTFRAEP